MRDFIDFTPGLGYERKYKKGNVYKLDSNITDLISCTPYGEYNFSTGVITKWVLEKYRLWATITLYKEFMVNFKTHRELVLDNLLN